jgi:predicted ATPase
MAKSVSPGALLPLFLGRSTFVGRERERSELYRLLDAAMRRQGFLVMIGGQAGIGKSRLGEEVALEAARRRLTVLAGRYRVGEAAEPCICFVEMLESALGQSGGEPICVT